MKKILTALITTSLIAAPLISAQANARSVHTERTVRYDGHGHRTVVKTERARQGGHTVKRSVVRKSQPAYASHRPEFSIATRPAPKSSTGAMVGASPSAVIRRSEERRVGKECVSTF